MSIQFCFKNELKQKISSVSQCQPITDKAECLEGRTVNGEKKTFSDNILVFSSLISN